VFNIVAYRGLQNVTEGGIIGPSCHFCHPWNVFIFMVPNKLIFRNILNVYQEWVVTFLFREF